MGVEKSLLYLQEHNSHGFTAHTDMAVGVSIKQRLVIATFRAVEGHCAGPVLLMQKDSQ
jgi:hypothetical protein